MTAGSRFRRVGRFAAAAGLAVAVAGGLRAQPAAARPAPRPAEVDDLVRLAVERNPRLARAAFQVDAARGRFTQAGLYPNPVLGVSGDELGDRTGPGGIWTQQVTQDLVPGRKLTLSQAVAAREVDRAALDLLAERYAVVGGVRAAFTEAYSLQQRAALLADLLRVAEQTADLGRRNALKLSRLDQVQLELEREKLRAEAEAVERERPAALRRLAAVAGDPRLPLSTLAGPFDGPPPEYDADAVRDTVLATHPEARAARVGVARAQLALQRAQADPLPTVSLSSGYTRQNQNKSSDWLVGVSMPLPLWNRNQGGVRTARAEFGAAVQEVGQVENDLADRVATAYRTYAAGRRKAQLYRTELLPRADEGYALTVKGFEAGQFDASRVLIAQRLAAEARIDYMDALGQAWRAAAELSGLLLEEVWPPVPVPPAPPK